MVKLEALNITKYYGTKLVLDKISLEARAGEVVALLGPNGAGKTSFFYILAGLIAVNKGEIKLNNELITDYPIYQRGRLGMGYLPQDNSIFRDMNVEENILTILQLKYKTKALQSQKLEELLGEFDIASLRKARATSLSGGERRRVEIARCLAGDPKFVLLDEPFAGVDPVAVKDIRSLILGLKNRNIGIIITDHNVRETLEIVDKAYIIYEGRLLFSGDKAAIIKNKEVERLYLGDSFK